MSEDGHITVCPHTSVTLTCTATQVVSITWRDQNRLIHSFVVHDDLTEETRQVYPYSLTVTVANRNGSRADLASTLEVMVDDINNGTNITCEIFQRHSHLVIYKTGIEG